ESPRSPTAAEAKAGTAYAERIYRLGTDRSLVTIWRELYRLDQKKVATAFTAACCDTSGTVTRKQLIKRAQEYRATAKRLLGWSWQFSDEGDHPQRRQILRDASKVLDELANKTQFYESPWVVDRQMADAEIRGYVLWLGDMVRSLFGKPLDKVVAAITSVALNLEKPISVTTVRYWRTYPGDIEVAVKAAQKASS